MMKRLYSPYFLFIFVSIFSLLLTSCAKKNKKGKDDEKVVAGAPSGTFNYLFCPVGDIAALDTVPDNPANKGRGSVLLKYYIDTAALTMHGWSYKVGQNTNREFTPQPNLKMKIGRDTTLMYQTGSYLGDFILTAKGLKTVQQAIKKAPKFKFVVFVPQIDTTSDAIGQVNYRLFLSEGSPEKDGFTNDFDAEGDLKINLNPIPPGGIMEEQVL